MEEEHKTREQLIDELAGMRQRIAELEAGDTERVRAEEKIEHLNLVLRAVRNVNQLITRERDRDRLLQGACETLIETRGYHSAWIALLDESEGPVTTAEAGLGKNFLPLAERLKGGELPDCGRRALRQSGGVVAKDPSSTCTDCPLSSRYGGRGAVTIRLEYGGKVYGLLFVSIPRDLAADEEEQGLFEEVAGDIAFALHSIELEEERKEIKEALRKSEERLYGIVTSVKDVLYSVDGEMGEFSYMSPAFERLLGYTLEDVREMGGRRAFMSQIIEGGKFAKQEDTFEQLLSREVGEVPTWEAWWRCKDGSLVCLEDRWLPIYDGERLISTYGVLRDVTERKAAEEALKEYSERLEEMVEERTKELREAQESLIRKEKLAVIGQLAGGVGHELRNPLGAISNAVYFLNMVLEEPEPEVKETLEILEKEVATSEKIISSLLDFGRARPPTRRKVDINGVVQEALSRIAVPENVEVVSQLDEALPMMLADPGQLVQVFGNIILNAVQAMSEGGRLVVKSEVPSSEWVAVSFADTGVGIPEENMSKLFEPLFTTKAKGVGLGLALTKTLVEGHGGAIEVESEVGVGATFTVRLPMSGS